MASVFYTLGAYKPLYPRFRYSAIPTEDAMMSWKRILIALVVIACILLIVRALIEAGEWEG